VTDIALESRPPQPLPDDRVLPFAVNALDVRGRVVHLGPAVDQILARHDYPSPVAKLLGEAITLTTLLGTSLKFSGRFLLQTKTDGPVSMLVVDFTTPDRIRAYAAFDADKIAAAVASGQAGPPDLLGRGHLALTVDQGTDASRYQGIVSLEGQSLEDVAHTYFEQSEQIPTRIRLAVAEMLTREPGQPPRHAWRAGGLLVQFLPQSDERQRRRDLAPGDAPEGATPLPSDDDDAWAEAKSLVDTVEDLELTDPDISPERLLFRLFHERGVRVFDAQPVVDKCRCSRDRVLDMLHQFTAEDVTDMTVDGEIVVTCEFCGQTYHFDPDRIDDE
jgi:molecular chaperone Hsp33